MPGHYRPSGTRRECHLAVRIACAACPSSSSAATSCWPLPTPVPLPQGAVLVRDGAIAEVGDRAALGRLHPRAQVVGGSGKLVLPGLINAHHHGMGISTVQLGYPDPGPAEPGLRDTPFESWMGTMLGLDAVDPYLGTLFKDVLLIESGVTAHLHMHFPSGTTRRLAGGRLRARVAGDAARAPRVGPAGGAGAALERPLASRLRRRRRVHRDAASRACATGRAASPARACPPRPTSPRSGSSLASSPAIRG